MPITSAAFCNGAQLAGMALRLVARLAMAPMICRCCAPPGLGIAYYGKPLLRAASACHIDYTDLSSAIHFMRLNGDPGQAA